MPARVNPRDWDRLFRPNAPRRGGPLRALADVLIFGVLLGILVVGLVFMYGYANERSEAIATRSTEQALAFATSTAEAAVAGPSATDEALSAVSTAEAETLQSAIGVGSVVAAGNVRNAPQVTPNTVIGQVCIGDEVLFLEQQDTNAGQWYRVRVTSLAEDCAPDRVAVETEGWASSTLLSQPNPITP